MSGDSDMCVIDRLRAAALSVVRTASDLGPLVAAGGMGAAAAGIPIALMMRARARESRARARNVGYGAGVATGLAAPSIIRGLHSMTREPGQ
jgi:hypothetical protein